MSQGRLSSAGTLIQAAAEAADRATRAPKVESRLTPSNVRPSCDALLQGSDDAAAVAAIRSSWLPQGGLPLFPGAAADLDLSLRAMASLKIAGQDITGLEHADALLLAADRASAETQALLQRADLMAPPKSSWLASIFGAKKQNVSVRYHHPLELPSECEHEGASVEALIESQEQDGSWSGRFGVNYVRGTAEALRVLREAGFSDREAPVLRAGEWIRSIQNGNGGWGESPAGYSERTFVGAPSSPVQTAWAILGLIDGGDTTSLSLESGVEYLVRSQNPDGSWTDDSFFVTVEPNALYANHTAFPVRYPLLALQSFVAAKREVA